MSICNLRIGTESLSHYFSTKEKESLDKALYFFGIIFIFAIGAGIGGILSVKYGIKTILISPILLLVAALIMIKKRY